MADYNGLAASRADTSPRGLNNMTSLSVSGRYPEIDLYMRFIPEAVTFARIFSFIWLAIGLPGNALSAKIWLERRMRKRNSSAIYVAALSINCIVFLLLRLLNTLDYHWGIPVDDFPVVCEVLNVLFFIPQYLTQLFVLGFTVDRYIAICHPLQRKVYCRPSRAVKVVVCMTIGAALIASFQAYRSAYDEGLDRCVERPETLVIKVWIWITELLLMFLIRLVTTVMNVFVIRGVLSVRRSRRQDQKMDTAKADGDKLGNTTTTAGGGGDVVAARSNGRTKKHPITATTVMLLSISFFYLITTLPVTILYIVSITSPDRNPYPKGPDLMTDDQVLADSTWTRFFIYRESMFVIGELAVAHFACNFFIFVPTARHFRQAVVEFLCCRKSTDFK